MPKNELGCLVSIFRLFARGANEMANADSLPEIRINKFFVSDAEAAFLRVLRRVVADRAYVLAQVSLRQLLWFPAGNRGGVNRERTIWRNKVAAKTIDFVLCHPSSLKPLVAIELDEPSHATPTRQTRDDEVERVLQRAGLPLLHVLTSPSYDTRELTAALAPYIASKE